jgi:hypothetical protein
VLSAAGFIAAEGVLEAAAREAVDELGNALKGVWCRCLGPTGEVGHRRGACVQAEERDGEVRDGLGDELFLGIVELRSVGLAIVAERVRVRARDRAPRSAR